MTDATEENAALVLVEKCIPLLALASGGFDPMLNNSLSQALALLRGVASFNRPKVEHPKPLVPGDPAF